MKQLFGSLTRRESTLGNGARRVCSLAQGGLRVHPRFSVLLQSPVLPGLTRNAVLLTRNAVLIAPLHLESRPGHFEFDPAPPTIGRNAPSDQNSTSRFGGDDGLAGATIGSMLSACLNAHSTCACRSGLGSPALSA